MTIKMKLRLEFSGISCCSFLRVSFSGNTYKSWSWSNMYHHSSSIACLINFLFYQPNENIAMNLTNRLVLVLLTAAAILAMNVSASSYYFGVCIRNCAQCKNMFGRYFKGEMCADLCVKSNGDFIPDCEDVASIERFLIQA
ncbi:eclosion hormone isoform X2 [Prorops nasuta]|uniref:eclosion hormone isoform X2 n=1 Tax=Prorops nasuta TaxID=863751 RepID=UPI0034CE27A8